MLYNNIQVMVNGQPLLVLYIRRPREIKKVHATTVATIVVVVVVATRSPHTSRGDIIILLYFNFIPGALEFSTESIRPR